ncbi:hypothetical protein PR202_gb08495 [Eleusine coracana subsp. coracana]|uniref:protein-serine/threonine phosphatase n=1 Tax=Eleusine coracana subsp. coracana TaxID=191504 RepID=A0AAV5EER6_ELECO|nr:hypothetical protein PR202_gb08495 [Eleusine coracana subsp. coracana]
MVEAAAGRRSGTCRRRPSGGGELQRQQLLHQRLLAAHVAMATTAAAGAPSGTAGRCLEDFADCLLGVLRALGLTSWAAARPPPPPQGQPRPPPTRGSADARRLAAELRAVPGRIAGNGASAVASLYTLQGRKGVNQDAMVFWENFCSRDDTIFCGVFDGHGPYGHLVAKRGHNLIIGNLGDSRAVLGTRNEINQLVAVQLTVDLKPNIPSEAQRIRQRKGRIFALPEEPEVARVWLPKYNSPGLAMARAFGDFCLKDHGVISMPDVSYHHITEKDEFVVLATDGVWDVLSNDEVVSIVSQATSQASAARFLVESAHRAWRNRFPTSKIDDCAVVCLFLNMDEESESSNPMANNSANSAEVTSDQPSATTQLNTGSSADIVTAMVTDGNEPFIVEAIAKPVTHAKDG